MYEGGGPKSAPRMLENGRRNFEKKVLWQELTVSADLQMIKVIDKGMEFSSRKKPKNIAKEIPGKKVLIDRVVKNKVLTVEKNADVDFTLRTVDTKTTSKVGKNKISKEHSRIIKSLQDLEEEGIVSRRKSLFEEDRSSSSSSAVHKKSTPGKIRKKEAARRKMFIQVQVQIQSKLRIFVIQSC